MAIETSKINNYTQSNYQAYNYHPTIIQNFIQSVPATIPYSDTKNAAVREAIEAVCTTFNHVIRNDLTPPFMLCQVLIKKYAEDQELVDALAIIYDSIRKINTTIEQINQLKDISAIPLTNYVGNTSMLKLPAENS